MDDAALLRLIFTEADRLLRKRGALSLAGAALLAPALGPPRATH